MADLVAGQHGAHHLVETGAVLGNGRLACLACASDRRAPPPGGARCAHPRSAYGSTGRTRRRRFPHPARAPRCRQSPRQPARTDNRHPCADAKVGRAAYAFRPLSLMTGIEHREVSVFYTPPAGTRNGLSGRTVTNRPIGAGQMKQRSKGASARPSRGARRRGARIALRGDQQGLGPADGIALQEVDADAPHEIGGRGFLDLFGNHLELQ